MALAGDLIQMLMDRNASMSTAESLTGGRLCARLIDVPGASAVVAGGIIAYAADAKTELLGVEESCIGSDGTVSEVVARQMAMGGRRRFGTTWSVSTTGNAGPDASDDKPVGRVHIAVAGPDSTAHRMLDLYGGRDAIRSATVDQCMRLLTAKLGNNAGTGDVDIYGKDQS